MNTAKARGPESPRDRQFREVPDPVLPPGHWKNLGLQIKPG